MTQQQTQGGAARAKRAIHEVEAWQRYLGATPDSESVPTADFVAGLRAGRDYPAERPHEDALASDLAEILFFAGFTDRRWHNLSDAARGKYVTLARVLLARFQIWDGSP